MTAEPPRRDPDPPPFDAALASDEASPAQNGLAWTSGVIAIASAVLLVFNAASPASWTGSLAPTELNARLHSAADAWLQLTVRLKLSAPRDALHDLWEKTLALPPIGAKARAQPDEPSPQR